MRLAPWHFPLWIAHRGAGKLAPENTLAAFRLGAASGYEAFECDVKLSVDDVPFLLHDATLERTSGAHGLAGHRPWVDLSRLDAGGWHSPPYAGEPLASLEAVAHFVRRNGFALNIEIKPTPGKSQRTGRIVAREAARLWADDPRPPLLSSFQPKALKAARAESPQLPRALLLDELSEGWFEMALALECVAVVADQALLDRPMVERLHQAGLRALAYTVNDAAMATRLIEFGIDGLITDAVDRLPPRRSLRKR